MKNSLSLVFTILFLGLSISSNSQDIKAPRKYITPYHAQLGADITTHYTKSEDYDEVARTRTVKWSNYGVTKIKMVTVYDKDGNEIEKTNYGYDYGIVRTKLEIRYKMQNGSVVTSVVKTTYNKIGSATSVKTDIYDGNKKKISSKTEILD